MLILDNIVSLKNKVLKNFTAKSLEIAAREGAPALLRADEGTLPFIEGVTATGVEAKILVAEGARFTVRAPFSDRKYHEIKDINKTSRCCRRVAGYV